MATGNIKFITYKTDTLRVVAADFLATVKSRVCRICEISPEAYDEAHYNLAEEWFRYHDYFEYTARVFMVSKTYHRWWNQQLAQTEKEFMFKNLAREISRKQIREELYRAIVTMNIHPSAELRRIMHEEGTSAIKANPELWNIKIYRHG